MFIRLAERILSGQLDDLFWVWLFTGSKPVLTGTAAAAPGSRRPARPASGSCSGTTGPRAGSPA